MMLTDMRILIFLSLTCILWCSCTDWRMNAFQDKDFDPEDAFVRFNYENTITESALDSINLPENTDTVILLPVALSAPPTDQTFEVYWETKSTGWTLNSIEIIIEENMAQSPILLPPGTFDQVLEIRLPGIDSGRLDFNITEVNPDIGVGYPGSEGRGQEFSIIIP